MKLSVVIPVYQSAGFLAHTVVTTFEALEDEVDTLELVLVDDNSSDNVWEVILQLAANDQRIKGIRLARNHGQHSAIFIGLKHATGELIATIDDDLQNPPSEIPKLLSAIKEGHDLAVGSFIAKSHSNYRNLGSKLIHRAVSKIFNSDRNFSHTNFRVMTREVADRISEFQGKFPYINGLAFSCALSPVNVKVRHDKRKEGHSNYTLKGLLKLSARILLGFSTIPIKLISYLGIFLSLCCFLIGLYALVNSFLNSGVLVGWSSIMVVISISNGLIFLALILITNLVFRIGENSEAPSRFLIREKTP